MNGLKIDTKVNKNSVEKLTNILLYIQKMGAGYVHVYPSPVYNKLFPLNNPLTVSIQILLNRFPILPVFNEPHVYMVRLGPFARTSSNAARVIENEASKIAPIINNYLQTANDRSIAMLQCQDELIEAGYGGWAKL